MIGADISSWQRGLTMPELKDKGVQFVIIKATQGTHLIDPCGADFYMAAGAAGIPMGVYSYSEAVTPEAARGEARYLLNRINGFPQPCGVFLDVETPEQLRLPGYQLQETVAAWCDVIRAAGYRPGVYSSELSAWSKLDPAALGEDVLVWVAHYGKAPDMPCDIWQFSESGTIPGREFKLDLDMVRSDRFAAIVRDAAAALTAAPSPSLPPSSPDTVGADGPGRPLSALPADSPCALGGPSPAITGALALLADYIRTPAFEANFLKYIEGRDRDG